MTEAVAGSIKALMTTEDNRTPFYKLDRDARIDEIEVELDRSLPVPFIVEIWVVEEDSDDTLTAATVKLSPSPKSPFGVSKYLALRKNLNYYLSEGTTIGVVVKSLLEGPMYPLSFQVGLTLSDPGGGPIRGLGDGWNDDPLSMGRASL